MVAKAAYWLIGTSCGLILLVFVYSSLRERERRAASIGGFLLILTAGLWGVVYLIGRENYLVLLTPPLFFGVVSLLFFLPVGKTSAIAITENDERVDERDTTFARFDLIPGTARFINYYEEHPDRLGVDERIRELPGLLAQDSRFYDPVRSRFVEALFELEARHTALVDGPVGDGREKDLTPREGTALVKKAAVRLGAEDVGVTVLDKRYLYSNVGRGPEPWGSEIATSHNYVVAFTVQMRPEPVKKAPEIGITEESAIQYLNAQQISIGLANFIRNLGYSARAHISGSNYQIILPAAAYYAGLGEIGRLGYLISPKHGARVRLGAVTTNLPLMPDHPIRFGVQEFCRRCKKCIDNCPSGAIADGGKTVVRGVEKWALDADRCFKYWCIAGTDCGLCMKVCPFSHPNTLVHNMIRYGIARSAFARRISLAGDDLLYGGRPG